MIENGSSSGLARRIFNRLDRLRHPEAKLSFSQEAEDLVLLRNVISPSGKTPFYVDVGANHPKWYSNTCLLYQRGWRGINIDPTPGISDVYKRQRPQDIFVEAVVGNGDVVEFVDFSGTAISGVGGELADERVGEGVKVHTRRNVTTRPLIDILNEHLEPHQEIDLLDIDVEGHEMAVLESNDWTECHPHVILVEITGAITLEDVISSQIASFLNGYGYAAVAKTGLTSFFADRERIRKTALGFEVVL